MTDSFQAAVIGAAAGLISGTVGSLVAPWIHWGIERRRRVLDARRVLVDEWRTAVGKEPFDKGEFRNSGAYASLRPHLTVKLVRQIESDSIVVRTGGRGAGADNLAPQLHDAIVGIERRWRMV